jgi:SAM-dependent MidA family methyltransferase
MSTADQQLAERLHALAASSGFIRYPQFIEAVLYAPDCGYYRRDRQRVGKARHTDFYTATSIGPVFGSLMAAAACAWVDDPTAHTFVEIGAEPGASPVAAAAAAVFGSVQVLRVDQPLVIPPRAVVFSNELLDAQPFARFCFVDGVWRERAVRWSPSAGRWVDCLAPGPAQVPDCFPATMDDGYCVDWPSGAESLVARLASQRWSGAWIAADYGLDCATLLGDRPAGTARTYRQHTMGTDLCADPGQHDITLHIAWDRIAAVLTAHRFEQAVVRSQESFFVHHAGARIAALHSTPDLPDLPPLAARRRSLMELLHPAHLGAKFQVLAARRDTVDLMSFQSG